MASTVPALLFQDIPWFPSQVLLLFWEVDVKDHSFQDEYLDHSTPWMPSGLALRSVVLQILITRDPSALMKLLARSR